MTDDRNRLGEMAVEAALCRNQWAREGWILDGRYQRSAKGSR